MTRENCLRELALLKSTDEKKIALSYSCLKRTTVASALTRGEGSITMGGIALVSLGKRFFFCQDACLAEKSCLDLVGCIVFKMAEVPLSERGNLSSGKYLLNYKEHDQNDLFYCPSTFLHIVK